MFNSAIIESPPTRWTLGRTFVPIDSKPLNTVLSGFQSLATEVRPNLYNWTGNIALLSCIQSLGIEVRPSGWAYLWVSFGIHWRQRTIISSFVFNSQIFGEMVWPRVEHVCRLTAYSLFCWKLSNYNLQGTLQPAENSTSTPQKSTARNRNVHLNR